jgi:DNA-binding transcriptional MerR regulator
VPERHYSPAEVSRLLGVSPKALRLWEARGLVAAHRLANGWRVFGRAEIARLTQVLALKALGLPLGRIGELLAGVGLDETLAAHEAVLEAQAAKSAKALATVRAARAKLASGAALSVDDLATLAKETAMTSDTQEMRNLFKPFIERHFTEAEQAEIKASAGPYDQAAVTRAWDGLFAEAKALMAADDVSSPAALDLARRWKEQASAFSTDAATQAKVRAVWNDAMADPNLAPKLPVDPAVFAFVRRIVKG